MFSNRKLILIIILIPLICVATYVIVVVIPARLAQRTYDGAKQIGKDINDLFGFTPKITVNNIVVLNQQSPVLELATLSQKFQHRYEWTNRWFKSTKKITITGMFEAKAGFDVNETFEIIINDDRATVRLPQPKLLSLESTGDIKFEDENGMWNWVNQEDRSRAINAYMLDAKRYASTASFVQQSKTSVEEQLKKILKLHEKEVVFEYAETIERDL